MSGRATKRRLSSVPDDMLLYGGDKPSRRRIRNRPEQVAHIAVIGFLRKALPTDALEWHTPNAAKRGHVERAHMRRMGLLPGFPDIAILWSGRLYFAEMKAGKGEKTDDQDMAAACLRSCGATDLGVWRTIEDCEAALLAARFPLRATVMGRGTIATPSPALANGRA